jgi:hypothetical protein
MIASYTMEHAMPTPTYDEVLAAARRLAPEEQHRLRDELAALVRQQTEHLPDREPLATIAETLDKIDRNPEIEGT